MTKVKDKDNGSPGSAAAAANGSSLAKSRKHPTCSRCRSHGKKDIRVLQHQCPFRNCHCGSCALIKKRSVIYRAQRNLDKQDDTSNESAKMMNHASSMTGMPFAPNGPTTAESNACASEFSSQGSSESNFAGHIQQGNSQLMEEPTNRVMYTKGDEIRSRVRNFSSLCDNFTNFTPSQLQAAVERFGNDIPKTIDFLLSSKWEHENDTKPFGQKSSWPSSSGSETSATTDPSLSHVYTGDSFAYQTAYESNAHQIPTYMSNQYSMQSEYSAPDVQQYYNPATYNQTSPQSTYSAPVFAHAYYSNQDTNGNDERLYFNPSANAGWNYYDTQSYNANIKYEDQGQPHYHQNTAIDEPASSYTAANEENFAYNANSGSTPVYNESEHSSQSYSSSSQDI